MKSNMLIGSGALIGMFLLILDGKTGISGAGQGIELCLKTVVPALFPFLVLSGIIVNNLLRSPITMLQPIGKLMHLPTGSESLLIPSFLSGYPVGAKSVADAYHRGNISKSEAERMLMFCSNAGPSFLFGIIAPFFQDPFTPWVLWGIHIMSAMTVAVMHPGDHRPMQFTKAPHIPITTILTSAMTTMGSICAWVILFRIILQFLDRWILWILPAEGQTLIYGLLELTNGCCHLGFIEDPAKRFILCSGMLAFGGLCVSMQTITVLNGLSLRPYLIGKLEQILISILLSFFTVKAIPIIPLWIILIMILRYRKSKITSSISESYVV